ncbi:MAG: LytR C-terminal domain-containing protein [Actinomycetota bacterium]|nr:LytR C-terminal domain-containing protein [Actinomycetota bacterium]
MLGWFVPWLLIAVVVGAAVWVLVNALGGEETKPVAAGGSPSPSASTTPSPTESKPKVAVASPSAKPSARPAKKPKPTKKKSPGPPALITAGMNVQVLNGTSDTDADDAVAARLEGLGFRIEAIDESSAAYDRTTVFWSYPEAQRAAQVLAERLGWVAQPKPDNLSDTVALHVVVGVDEV